MKKMKLYTLLLLSIVMLSSCSMLNSWSEPAQASIKIDYKNDSVTVNNTTGHDYSLKLVSDEENANGVDTLKVSDDIDIKQGEHNYDLKLTNIAENDKASFTKFDTDSLKENSMYISTSVKSKAELDENVYAIAYRAYSNVKSDNSKGEVLFNSNLTDNYFKMVGFPVNQGGGISTQELNTAIIVDSSEVITIGSITHSENTESPLDHSWYEPITSLFGSSTHIKIDYINDTATIDNQTGKEFDLKVISYDADRQNEKTVASDFVTIEKGKQTYSLNFKANKSANILADKNHENFMLISTESKGYESNDGFNVRVVTYCGSGNFKDISRNDKVLFNTYANSNLYMKVEGLPTTEDICKSGEGSGGSVDMDKKYKGQILLIGIDNDGNTFSESGGPVEPL